VTAISRAVAEDLARIEKLIGALEELDPAAREPARALLEVVLDLHGAGLKRVIELIDEAPGGALLLERMAADERVEALLLLHGLHPDDLQTRIHQVLERLHPHVGVHGLSLETVAVSEEAVRIRIHGDVRGKGAKLKGLREELETAVLEAAPEVARVEIDGLDDLNATFVPVSSLRKASAINEAP
jgi:Fe-S cluster biogenesis protein NfuA